MILSDNNFNHILIRNTQNPLEQKPKLRNEIGLLNKD